MGGDNTTDSTQARSQSPDATTQAMIDQLNSKLTQDATQQPQQQQPGDTRAGYGVAPAASNLGAPDSHADPYFHGTVRGGRAGYSPSGTLVPGGAGVHPAGPGGEVVPNFQQLHSDQARNPNQPYTPNPLGQQAAQQMGGGGRNVPGRPTRDPLDDPNESRIQQAISMRGQYLSPWTPVFGGLGAVTAPVTAKLLTKGADGLVERTKDGSFGNKVGHYIQDNYDLTRVNKGGLVKPVSGVGEADLKYGNLIKEAKDATQVGDDAARRFAQERLSILEKPLNASTTVDMKVMNAANEAKGQAGYFSEEEIATVEGKFKADATRAAQQRAMEAAEEKAAPSAFKIFKAGAVGVGVDILAVNADRSLAKAIGGTNSVLQSWNTEQILAPTALALGAKWAGDSFMGKAAMVAGSVLLSRAIDSGSNAIGIHAPAKWNAVTGVMNGWDGFGVASGLAIAATTENPWAKFAAVTAGVALPKLAHLFQDSTPGNLVNLYSDVKSDVKANHESRSFGSLEDLKKDAMKLDDKKPDWLFGKVSMNRQTVSNPQTWASMSKGEKLESLRDDAALSAGLGEDWLRKGSRIVKQGEPEYTLGGYDIDMGGQAMHFLVTGKDSAVAASRMTAAIIANNNDSNKPKILVNGEEPKESEVKGLDKLTGEINDSLDKILNKEHQCRDVMQQLVKDCPSANDDWRQTYILPTDQMILLYAKRGKPDQVAETNKILGKLYRDQALAYIAFAEAKLERGNDGGGALSLLVDDPNNHQDIFASTGQTKNYNGAQGTFLMAARFDPDNKDLAQIKTLWSETMVKAAAAANKQLTDPNINILNYGGLAPHAQ